MRSAVLMIAAWSIAMQLQSSVTSLTSLTVPRDRLPTGCELKPIVPPDRSATQVGTTRVTTSIPSVYLSNPWSGTTTRLLVETRKMIDPPPSVYYDAPPAKATAIESEWVQHVVEAYHAVYDSADGSRVEVSAIKFDDPKLASPTPSVTSQMLSNSSPGRDGRIVKGDVVIKLAGNPTTDCFKAIDAYIRALK